jgi:hypothetical protein
MAEVEVWAAMAGRSGGNTGVRATLFLMATRQSGGDSGSGRGTAGGTLGELSGAVHGEGGRRNIARCGKVGGSRARVAFFSSS